MRREANMIAFHDILGTSLLMSFLSILEDAQAQPFIPPKCSLGHWKCAPVLQRVKQAHRENAAHSVSFAADMVVSACVT